MPLPQRIRESVQRQAQNMLVTGQRFKRFDQIRQRHFWSTYRLTPNVNGFIASGEFDLFQTPSGQAGQGFTQQLTLLETNWPGSNRVADNQNLEVTELGVSCKSRILDGNGVPRDSLWNGPNYSGAENEILRNMQLSITYLTNTVPLGLCTDFAQASGPRVGQYAPNSPELYDIIDDGGGASLGVPDRIDVLGRNLVTNGFAAPGLRRRFTIPILLQHGETFRFTLGISAGRGPWVQPPFPTPAPDDDTQGLGPGTAVFDVRVDMWATESFVEKS